MSPDLARASDSKSCIFFFSSMTVDYTVFWACGLNTQADSPPQSRPEPFLWSPGTSGPDTGQALKARQLQFRVLSCICWGAGSLYRRLPR